METKKLEGLVFETTVGFTLFIAVTAITALVYQLITVAVPLLESSALPRVLTGF
jgi:hypothetical protein